MNTLVFINSYIKYAYFIIGVVLLVLIIKLAIGLKPILKSVDEITRKTNTTQELVDEINKKIEKIKYTNEHSLPLFKYIFFIIVVISAVINDLKKNKSHRKSIVKTSIKEYSKMKMKYKPSKTARKELINAIRKATI